MSINREKMMSNAKQAADDLEILNNANIEEIEKLPTWNVIDSLRLLQRFCKKNNYSIHEITPELIIEELNKPKIYV